MRRPSVSRSECISRLTKVFRSSGYARASLAELASATGLQRSSLYHYFPGGKAQMLKEVLDESDALFQRIVLTPLHAGTTPRERFAQLVKNLNRYYDSGKENCILGTLSAETFLDEVKDRVRGGFNQWVSALEPLFQDHGLSKKESGVRAHEVVAVVQGGLILARAMGRAQLFRTVLKRLEETAFR